MTKAEYMKVQYKHLPEDIKLRYNLQDKVTSDNYVYIQIKKGHVRPKTNCYSGLWQLKEKS